MGENDVHLNIQLMRNILHEFEWPCPYTLEDYMPNGIILSFPKSSFVFDEGSDGDVLVRFLPRHTNGHSGLHIGHALSVFIPLLQRKPGVPVTPGLVDTGPPIPSEEKTKDEVRNACKIMLTHLTKVIEGDFSWVEEYLKSRPNF